MTKLFAIFSLLALSIFTFSCSSGGTGSSGKTIKSGPAGNNLTATLSSADGVLRNGKNTFTLTFADAGGKPMDVGAVSVNFFMPAMGSMAAMNDPATLTTTGTPGVYSGTVNLQMAGEWQIQITYEGPAGNGKATLPITAQ
jgi:hypothetical protein